MALSIDYETHIIFIPQSYLTLTGGTIYNLDVNQLRIDLKDVEDSILGIPHPDTHKHTTETTIVGTTYARFVEILVPYSIEFEDGQYTVTLSGANNNVFDVGNGILVQNQVQVVASNSAGFISVTSGSGLSTEQEAQLLDLYRLHGLDVDSTLRITDTSRKVNDGNSDVIDQTISDDGTTTTVDRV